MRVQHIMSVTVQSEFMQIAQRGKRKRIARSLFCTYWRAMIKMTKMAMEIPIATHLVFTV